MLLEDHRPQSSPLGGRCRQPETGEQELPPRERRTHRPHRDPFCPPPLQAQSAASTDRINPTPVVATCEEVRRDTPSDGLERLSYPLKYMTSTRANMASDSSASPAIPNQERSNRRDRGSGGAPPGAMVWLSGEFPPVRESREQKLYSGPKP